MAVGLLAIALALPAPANAVVPRSTSSAARGVDTDGDGLRDSFETRWGVSDPHLADTDDNGLIDAIEDPDDDRLSNLAEQHFRTEPSSADSDHDGIRDGRDDADGNGVKDHLEQDHRRVPGNLTPTPALAPKDKPTTYHDGCHSLAGDGTIHPCVYGKRKSATSIAVFGDSHAAQWLPSLIKAANRQGWSVITLTKSGCPAAKVEPAAKDAKDILPCRKWRRRAIAWLNENRPTVIISASAGSYAVAGRGGSQAATDAAWMTGWAATLDALPKASVRILLADTRRNRVAVGQCLEKHPQDLSACQTARNRGVSGHHNAVERKVALAHGARFADLNPLLCSYDPCPIVAGSVLMWRDDAHLTATFSTVLAPSLQDLVRRAIRGVRRRS